MELTAKELEKRKKTFIKRYGPAKYKEMALQSLEVKYGNGRIKEEVYQFRKAELIKDIEALKTSSILPIALPT